LRDTDERTPSGGVLVIEQPAGGVDRRLGDPSPLGDEPPRGLIRKVGSRSAAGPSASDQAYPLIAAREQDRWVLS
jgi:hypothetical protein